MSTIGSAHREGSDFVPCQGCQMLSAQPGDLFCVRCRQYISDRLVGWAAVGFRLRLAGWLMLDALLALTAASIAVFFALFLRSGIGLTIMNVIGLLFSLAIIAPLFASLEAWGIKALVVRSGRWGWVGVLRVVALAAAAMLFFGVMSFLPRLVAVLGLACVEWGAGVGVGVWQERLLPMPARRREHWRVRSLYGWSIGCAVHAIVGLVIPSAELGIFVGVFLAFGIAGGFLRHLIAHDVFELRIKQDLNRDYQAVWYNS